MQAFDTSSEGSATAQRRLASPEQVVHEVNNVLTYAYSLVSGLAEEDAVVRAAAGRGLRRCLDLVAGLVEDFDGGDAPRTNAADVAEIAATAAELGSPSLNGAHVELVIEPGLASVAIAPLRLLQVLLNLVINAGHALAQVGDGRVTVRAVSRGARVVLSVEDNGPGIDPHVGARIFDVGLTTDPDRGSGLGLAVCDQVIRDARGTIWFEGRPRGGCVFHLSLPAA